MNVFVAFWIELAITLSIGLAIILYLGGSLKSILVDLCGTEERARFWSAFTAVMLIGAPVVSALGYRPLPADPEVQFFEIAKQLGGNIIYLLLGVVAVGFVIVLFAATAPRPRKEA